MDLTRPGVPAGLDAAYDEGATIFGYLKAESGVGEAGRRMFRALQTAGCNVSAKNFSIPAFEENDDTLDPHFVDRSPFRFHIFQLNADTTLQLPRLVGPGDLAGRYKIGCWVWELSTFPDAWRPAFDQLDEIWVPSDFVRQSVAAVSAKPVMLIPYAVPIPEVEPSFDRRHFGIDPEAFVVLSTIDLNSFVVRKNPLGAVEAFQNAFRDQAGRFEFVLKMHGGKQRPAEARALQAALAGRPEVTIIDRVLPRRELTGLQACCDAYLSLHRSEGFGLNIAEAMALGKLVIATDYGGNRDFVDDSCGAPVRFSMTPVGQGEYPYAAGQAWADPDLHHAAELMRRAENDRDWRMQMGMRARSRMAKNFSSMRVGELMVQRLRTIGRHP